MYERFYRLDTDPFRLSPDVRFCYPHQSFAKARAYMEYAFHCAEGFVMVTGRPGMGKTTLIGDLVERLPKSLVTVGSLVTTQLEAEDLLELVAHAFGLNSPLERKSALLEYLESRFRRERARGRRVLLIIDEAQNLTPGALEELRLLTNLQQGGEPLLQVFLVGQESLQDLVHQPGLEQVLQRIVAACHLEPLNEEDTRAYALHRLRLAGWRGTPRLSEALHPIAHRFSEGIPRRINLFWGRLLLHGVVERKHSLGVNEARLVVAELYNERLTRLDPSGDAVFDAPDRFDSPQPESEPASPEPASSEPATPEAQAPASQAPSEAQPTAEVSLPAEPSSTTLARETQALLAEEAGTLPPPFPSSRSRWHRIGWWVAGLVLLLAVAVLVGYHDRLPSLVDWLQQRIHRFLGGGGP